MPKKFDKNGVSYEMNITDNRSEDSKTNNSHKIENIRNIHEINKKINKEDASTTQKCIELLLKYFPKILDIYEIKECIGSGSESLVYKIIHKITNKSYALKLIFNNKKENRNIIEFNILNRLKHRNIILFYGVVEVKNGQLDCVIMEYAKFGNLRDFQKNILKKQYFSEQLLCFLAYQILNGLNHCHKCKVAHLDLKPQNIIIDEFLNVKIIDFSVSIDYNRIKTNIIKLPFRGTNFYIAPEVIESKIINVKDLNKVDLYSFGVILYNLAFGQYPYNLNSEDSKNYDKILYKIQNNQLEFNDCEKYYSKYFIDFLKKLLEKDIKKRIDIKLALNHYWIIGGNILLDDRENTYNSSCFLINIITDHCLNFCKFINK